MTSRPRLAAALGLAFAGCAAASVETGRSAPALRVELLDGAQFDLAAHRGEVVLVNFWATWCPPCRAEMPALDAAFLHHRAEGFTVVGLSGDKRRARDDVKQAMAPFHYPAALLGDARENGFGEPPLYPFSYLIDRRGVLVRAISPSELTLDGPALERLLAPLLAEKP